MDEMFRKAAEDHPVGQSAAYPNLHSINCKTGLVASLSHFTLLRIQDAKYIFLTGDYVHDRVDLYSASENGRHISNVTWSLQAAFPNTTVIPLAGNHEPNIVNMYPPPAVQEDVRFNLGWMYSAISEPFEAHMGNSSQVALFKRGGFFSVSPTPGLRLIILNTNLCYIQNFWLPFDPIDPIDQLRWFSEELGKAEAAAEHVYVLAHIPPGKRTLQILTNN